jgi:cytochrome c
MSISALDSPSIEEQNPSHVARRITHAPAKLTVSTRRATVGKENNMRYGKILVGLGVALLVLGIASTAVGQEKATAQDIVSKVQQAADTLGKSATSPAGEASLMQFNQKDSPWVFKDTYVFVLDCSKNTMAAHPIKPDLVGKDISQMTDTQGSKFFGQLCAATQKPSGVWVEYWWAKPGEKEGSRKISYARQAGNSPFVVAAGIYDDKATIAELEKASK